MRINYVLRAVAEFYGISSVWRLLMPSRKNPFLEARQMVCYILKDEPKIEVAALLRIDRTTAYYHADRMEGFILLYPDMKDKYLTIINLIDKYHDDKANP